MLHIITQSQKTAILKVSGSVSHIVDGTVDAQSLHPIHRGQFRFAFGDGTFSNNEAVGESIILDSKPYVMRVKDGRALTETQSNFFAPFLVGVDSSQPVGAFLKYEGNPSITLNELYEKIAHEFPQGFAVVGYALASPLHSSYLKKPPIFKENITTKRSDYWAHSLKEKQPLCFFGVVLPQKAKKEFPSNLIDRLFYKGTGSGMESHTHGALIETGSFVLPIDMNHFLAGIRESHVVGVHHVQPETLIQEGSFALYPIEVIHSSEKVPEGVKHGRETLRRPFTIAERERSSDNK